MKPPLTPLSTIWHDWIKPIAVAFIVVLCLIFALFRSPPPQGNGAYIRSKARSHRCLQT